MSDEHPAGFTTGSLASRLGEVPIFALMHRRHASLHGYQTIKRYGVAPEYLDSQVVGTSTWLKKPNSKRSGRTYPGGFPQAAVATAGGEWSRPAKGELMFDVPEQTTDNARFLVRFGTMPSVNPRFVLTPQHSAVFEKATNTYRMSAGFNRRAGLFRGRFYKTVNC